MYISIWSLAVVSLLVLLGFVNHSQQNTVCKTLEVKIQAEEAEFFIERADVLAIINEQGMEMIGQPYHNINVKSVEEMVQQENPYVKNVSTYKQINGVVHIEIDQRRPIVRVFTSKGESFYLDESGKRMPLSDKYTARILVANGYVSSESKSNDNTSSRAKLNRSGTLAEIHKLASYIDQRPFWKSQIQQVYVNNKGELELIPRVGNHKIILGDFLNLDEKFNKLWVFYMKGLKNTDWNKYETINLKYKDQIVCTQR